MKTFTYLTMLFVMALAFSLSACGDELCRADDDCPRALICADGECVVGENRGFDIGEENDHQCPDEPCTPPQLIAPPSLSFYYSQPGTAQWLPLELANAGQRPLTIDGITIADGSVFAVTFPRDGRDDDGFFPRPGNDGEHFSSTTLWPDDDPLLVRVWFYPEDEETQAATLQIESNDPARETFEIDLHANRMRACLVVDQDEGIDFQVAPTGEYTKRTLTLQNCNVRRAVHLNSITIADSDGGAFSIDPASYPGNLPGETHLLPPMQTTTVVVRYRPEQVGAHQGELFISSTDERSPNMRIPLIGQGADAGCPEAAIAAAVDDAPPTAVEALATLPLDTVHLQVVDAEDPEGGELTYEWSLISRPFGSDARLSPSAHIADPDLWLDLVGTYVVELTVRNDQGLGSCSPARLVIEAIPENDIYIQLDWYTQIIPEPEGGEGTDLDLHYLHPNGQWGSPDWSVSVHDQEQTWEGGLVRMVMANAWGEFPEVLTHDGPVDGHHYAVGVHYNWDFFMGSSEASVRIFFNGLLGWEIFDHSIHELDDLWFIGHIEWGDAPRFHFVDELITGHDLVASEPPWF